MMRFKGKKAHSALRDDVQTAVDGYISQLQTKSVLMKHSLNLIQEAVLSVRAKNFERAEDLIYENNTFITSAQVIDADLSRIKTRISSITGIENENKAVEKVFDHSLIHKSEIDKIITEIHKTAFQSDKYLDEISQAFESEISRQKKEFESVKRTETMRNLILQSTNKDTLN